MTKKRRVLFICVHNSARSILAEFLTNSTAGDRYRAYSAGLASGTLNSYALLVLEELGIDTAAARSRSIQAFRGEEFDLVVTVCSPAEGECPLWLGAGKKAYLPFADPSQDEGTAETRLAHMRALRDEMKAMLIPFIDSQFP